MSLALLFTPHLHRQLKIAAREGSTSTFGYGLSARSGSMSVPKPKPSPPLALPTPTTTTATTPIMDGWEGEEAVNVLQQISSLLEKPFFLYSDWGSRAAMAAARRRRQFSVEVIFHKPLSLATGQQALLDLWEYVVERCEKDLVHCQYRGLYLRCVVHLSRRVEFVRESEMDGQHVVVSKSIAKRYQKLLYRSLGLSTATLRCSPQSRNDDDDVFFTTHLYAIACFRWPICTTKVMTAVEEGVASLHMGDRRYAPRHRSTTEPISAGLLDSVLASKLFQHHSGTLVIDEAAKIDCVRRGSSLEAYACERRRSSINRRRGVENTLSAVLQLDAQKNRSDLTREAAFLRKVPIFLAPTKHDHQLDAPTDLMQHELDRNLNLFLDRLRQPRRKDLFIVSFVRAYLQTVAFWCEASCVDSAAELLWHCIPGYLTILGALVVVVRRMCFRRPRKISRDDELADPFLPYWKLRDINVVMNAIAEALRNDQLINAFVEIVLEGTNIFDPTNVNYSFTILGRVFDTAKTGLPSRLSFTRELDPAERPFRRRVWDAIDDNMFSLAMRKTLQCAHVQVLLKSLTFLYGALDYLPATTRRRILSELVLRDNFFRFFLHWNDEIRKIFSYILVFKLFASNRLKLPCTGDSVLLNNTIFYPKNGVEYSPSSPTSYHSFEGWRHLSEITRDASPNYIAEREEQKQRTIASCFRALLAWAPPKNCMPPQDALFHASLDNEDLSVDLLVASKLDSQLKMVADQINTHEQQAFPVELEAYAERAVAQYVSLLWEYYKAARECLDTPPTAPTLEFVIPAAD